MDNEGHDDLIDEVADALTLRQDVDWEGCARLVTPSNRWLLETLRVIARVAAECRASVNASRPPCDERRLFAAAAGSRLMVILHRERLLLHIDSWVYPEGGPAGGIGRRGEEGRR